MDNITNFIRKIIPAIFRIAIPVFLISFIAVIILYWKNVAKFLEIYKDSFSSIESIVTACGFLYAIIISYIKFFAGRLFIVRANISIDVTLEKISESVNLHLIRVILKNPGDLSLKIKNVKINFADYNSDNVENQHSIENFSCVAEHIVGELKPIISPAQDSVYYTARKLSKNTKAVTYEAVVEDFLGNKWTDMILVGNDT